MCTISADRSSLIDGGTPRVAAAIAATLARFGDGALAFARDRKIRVVPLARSQRYRDASASLRRLGVDVDAWPVPPISGVA